MFIDQFSQCWCQFHYWGRKVFFYKSTAIYNNDWPIKMCVLVPQWHKYYRNNQSFSDWIQGLFHKTELMSSAITLAPNLWYVIAHIGEPKTIIWLNWHSIKLPLKLSLYPQISASLIPHQRIFFMEQMVIIYRHLQMTSIYRLRDCRQLNSKQDEKIIHPPHLAQGSLQKKGRNTERVRGSEFTAKHYMLDMIGSLFHEFTVLRTACTRLAEDQAS